MRFSKFIFLSGPNKKLATKNKKKRRKIFVDQTLARIIYEK